MTDLTLSYGLVSYPPCSASASAFAPPCMCDPCRRWRIAAEARDRRENPVALSLALALIARARQAGLMCGDATSE